MIDILINHVKCDHISTITLDDSMWCKECDDWIDGIDCGEVTIYLHDDGDIKVIGGGYVDDKEKNDDHNLS